MTTRDVVIPTPDGACSATLHFPTEIPVPAVIMFPDAGGVREALQQMAAKLSGLGYVVLLPDIFHRAGGFEPFDMKTVFGDPDERARLMELLRTITAEGVTSDAGAFLDYLDALPEVRGGGVGTTGYCKGGWISLTVAGRHPDRIAAAASFHGGNLAAADDPDSPHLLADRIQAAVYIAAAENDRSFPAEQLERLEAALTDAKVRHTIETYPAAHGFAVTDFAVYDAAADERHWAATERFFGTYLRA